MRSPPRCLPSWALVLLGLCAATCAALAAWRPGLFFVDDAWFYLQIGRNIAQGAGSTFSGVGATNGYHPLWQALVAALGWLLSGDKGAMLAGVHLVQAGLVAVAAVTLVSAGRRFGLDYAGLVLPAVVLGLLSDRGWGSEGMLSLALHGLVLLAWARVGADGLRGMFATGLLTGLLVLARLDTAFLALSLVLVSLARGQRPGALVMAAGASIPVVPYLLANLVFFGGVVPVSGAIKSTFPVPAAGDPLARLGILGTAATALGLLSLILASRPTTRARPLLAALGLGALLHGGYTALFTSANWSTDVVYYYVTGVVNAGFCAAELTRRYLGLLPSLGCRGQRRLVGALAVIAAVGGTGRAVRGALDADTGTEQLADWIRDQLGPDARIATVDAPGRLAWISGLPVFALDGLTAPPGFDDALRSPDVFAWAERMGITHIVSLRQPYDAPWVRIEPTPDALVLHVQAPHSRLPAGDIHLVGPPLVDRCTIQAPRPCDEPVGVWAWPADP